MLKMLNSENSNLVKFNDAKLIDLNEKDENLTHGSINNLADAYP